MNRSIIETSESILKMLHNLLGDEILNKTNKELMEIVEKQLGYKLKNGMFIKSTVSSSTSQSLITSATQSASQLAQSVGSSATQVVTAVKDKLATTIEIVSTSGTGATATVTAGKVGVMATSLPTAFAAIAPLLGVGVGAGLYKLNPDFWEKVSRTLLPFCYDDTDMLPAVVDENGQTYYSQEVIESLKTLFENENVFTPSFSSDKCGIYKYENEYYCIFQCDMTKQKVIEIPDGIFKLEYKKLNINFNAKYSDKYINNVFPFVSNTRYDDIEGFPDVVYYSFYKCVNNSDKNLYNYGISIYNSLKYRNTGLGYFNENNEFKTLNTSNTRGTYTDSPPYTVYYIYETLKDDRYFYKFNDFTFLEGSKLPTIIRYGELVDEIPAQTTLPQGLEQISTDSNYSKENGKDILSGVDEDGNITTDKYIPVRLPSSTDGSSTNTKENSQTNLDEDGVLDNSLISQIMESINNMYKPLPNINYNPDKDVTEEGDGDSPTKPIIPNDTIPEEPNDDGESPSLLPVGSLNTSGLVTIYNPTESEVKEFGKWLWTTWSSDLMDTLAKMFNNPMDAVIGLHLIYATPIVNTRDTIKAGFLDSKVETNVVEQRYVSIFCGSMIVPQYWGNYLDFLPYTKTYIYLPFIGIQKLNTMDIVSSAVSIEYKIDVFNGSCIALITVARENYSTVMYEFSGNCAVQIPITSGNYSSILSSAISSVASGVGFVMGGAGVGATIAFAGSNMMGNKTDVQHSGSFGASHGAMGIKKPYIMVKRPIQKVVPDYNTLYGYPAHKMVKISDCSGYLRVKEVDVLSATATDEEKKIIENLLKQGVFV